MSVDLRLYRESLSSGGLEAVQALPGFFEDLAQAVPEDEREAGHHFEALAFDALASSRMAWGCLCMSAATQRFHAASSQNDAGRCSGQSQRILEEAFLPYTSDREFFDELVAWSTTALREVTKIPALPHTALSDKASSLSMRLTWTYRLVRSKQLGFHLESEKFFDQLGLSFSERVFLWICSALCSRTEGGLRFSVVDELLRGPVPGSDDARVVMRIDGRIRQNALLLIHKGEDESAPMDSWWIQPHPDLVEHILSGSDLRPEFLSAFREEVSTEDLLSLWKAAFHKVGLIPPTDLEHLVERLPTELETVGKICQRLSVEMWTEGEPGKPVPQVQLQSAVAHFGGASSLN